MTDEAAYVLFPNDRPADPPASPQIAHAAAVVTGAMDAAPSPDQAQAPTTVAREGAETPDPATKLFPSETGATEEKATGEVTEFFDGHRMDALKDGDDGRAEALQSASGALLDDVRASGGLAADLAEALGYVRSNLDRPFGLAASEAELQAGESKAMGELANEYRGDTVRLSADLGAARRLIDHLEERAPGTKASLEFSGAGNDPRLIRLAIKEARRRGL